MFTSVDPSTDAPLRSYAPHSDEEVEERLHAAVEAWRAWRTVPAHDRCALLDKVAALLEDRREALAGLMTVEMGKPIAQARAEVDKCAWLSRHVAASGPAALAPEPVATDSGEAWIEYAPLGAVLAIMPWNFPLWQVFRFGVPALAAGNALLVKHAPNVTGCALAIEGLFADAGVPHGLLQMLLVDVDRVPALIADERIQAVTLTGSVRAGRAVAGLAGQQAKKSVLELGGSDPFVVLDDADIAAAAEVGAASRLLNSGQSCICAKRFIVVDAVAAAFEDAFRAQLEAAVVGDPGDAGTTVGPLARADLREQLHDQVAASRKEGAHLVIGGEVPAAPGFFYPVTMLTGVTPVTTAGCQETFGPVAAVMRAADDEEAVALANATSYGLGASVWTADIERGTRLGSRIEAGAVAVNDMVVSDPRMPFGGVKQSGYGRELGVIGMREFTNIKTLRVADRG